MTARHPLELNVCGDIAIKFNPADLLNTSKDGENFVDLKMSY